MAVRATEASRVSVVAAFWLFGFRNAGTPLLIASLPVSAAQPDEKARASRAIIARLSYFRVASRTSLGSQGRMMP